MEMATIKDAFLEIKEMLHDLKKSKDSKRGESLMDIREDIRQIKELLKDLKKNKDFKGGENSVNDQVKETRLEQGNNSKEEVDRLKSRTMRVESLVFEGIELQGWNLRAEKLFEIQNVSAKE